MTNRAALLMMALAVAACSGGGGDRSEPARRYALGRAATPAEIAARNLDVAPDGEGLPPGAGTAALGADIFAAQCAPCHGVRGEGRPPLYPRLVGRDPNAASFGFATYPTLARTIGDYWPYATTVFDYVRRAMPPTSPGSLSNDQLYSVTAFLLAANSVIPGDATLDSASLVAVKMPAADKFVRDNRSGSRVVK